MCGLTGASLFKPSREAKLILTSLFIDNETRGTHSSGISMVSADGKTYRTYRSKDKASLFLLNHMTIAKELALSKQVICHTRHATMGDHTTDNAHPFSFKDKNSKTLIGAHNGWLIDWNRTNNKILEKASFKLFCEQNNYNISDFKVDSQVIFHHIVEKGDLTAISDIEGAMALSIIYKGDVILYRRESKPLYIAETDMGIFYSSKESGLKYALEGYSNVNIRILEPNKLFFYRNGKLKNEVEVDSPKLEIKIDEGPSAFYSRNRASYHQHNQGYQHNRNNSGRNSALNISNEDAAIPNKNGNRNNDYSSGFSNEAIDLSNILKEKVKSSPLSILNKFNHNITDKDALDAFGYSMHSPVLLSEELHKGFKMPADQGIVLARIVDEVIIKGSNMPLKDWRIVINGYPDKVYKTGSEGFCAIALSKKVIGQNNGKIELLVHPPTNYSKLIGTQEKYPKVYWARKIDNIQTSKVSEVTFCIPFLKFEKDQATKDEGSFEEYNSFPSLLPAKWYPEVCAPKPRRTINSNTLEGCSSDSCVSSQTIGGKDGSNNNSPLKIVRDNDSFEDDYEDMFHGYELANQHDELEDELNAVMDELDEAEDVIDPPRVSALNQDDIDSLTEFSSQIIRRYGVDIDNARAFGAEDDSDIIKRAYNSLDEIHLHYSRPPFQFFTRKIARAIDRFADKMETITTIDPSYDNLQRKAFEKIYSIMEDIVADITQLKEDFEEANFTNFD